MILISYSKFACSLSKNILIVAISFLAVQILYAFPSTELYPAETFKMLESGENSGEAVNHCCQREPKYVTVGYGISEGEVRIDVGQCRQKCAIPSFKPLKRDEFDRYLRKYPDIDPIQIFLSLQNKNSMKSDSVTSGENPEDSSTNNHHHHHHGHHDTNSYRFTTSCSQSICLPASIKRESFYDLSGEVKDIDVIESCDCVSLPQEGCQRLAYNVKIHVDTPYERQVDIGQCWSNATCTDDSANNCLSCRPVRNRTIAADGPSGAHCLSIIDECQCVGECFRVRQFLKVYDYAHVFETKAALMDTFNTTNNSNTVDSASSEVPEIPSMRTNDSSVEPMIKVIDIGRCSGSCSGVPLTSKCLLWSNTNNGTCLSALTGGRSKCTATKFVSHSYTDKHGEKHTVVSVTGCGCR